MKTALLLALVIAVLALSSMACVLNDIPRLGDGMGIGEFLEKTTCESAGGSWDNARNTCN